MRPTDTSSSSSMTARRRTCLLEPRSCPPDVLHPQRRGNGRHEADERRYEIAAAILRDLDLAEGVRLLTNNPDKIIFVGEALVGNEAVDQLTKFDRALRDFSAASGGQERGIDGMLVTKWDTVDDKVR